MPVTNEVLVERLDAVIKGVSELKDDIKVIAARFDERLRQLEKDRISDSAQLDAKAGAAHRRLDGHDDKIKDLEDAVKPIVTLQQQVETLNSTIQAINKAIEPMSSLVWTFRILAFIGSTLGVSIILLIWALITGQAQLVFPPHP